MIRAALRHPWRRYGPRCAAAPPWRLADAGLCICPRGHEHHDGPSPDWHADGTGWIWNADRWAWRGPVISLEDVWDGHVVPSAAPLFTEDPWPGEPG